MTCRPTSLLAVGLLALAVGSHGSLAQEIAACEGRVELSQKTQRQWKMRLPAESFQAVGTSFAFADTLGRDFGVRLEGTALLVDTDGDGETDVTARGAAALVILRGESHSYAVRLVNENGWRWAAGGMMVGELAGTPIAIVDQNGNGRYDDYGADAMLVGRGRVASFLSRVVNVNGCLLDIDVAVDGTSFAYEPYTGEAGTLDLSACETKAKLIGAVVKSRDGRYSFETSSGPLSVPAGEYELAWGEIGLGETSVKIRGGGAAPMAVAAGQTTAVEWGGPVRAEFAWLRKPEAVELSPDAIWYFGAGGEEYFDWFPNGKSPKILVADKKTGREIAEAYFPGSC